MEKHKNQEEKKTEDHPLDESKEVKTEQSEQTENDGAGLGLQEEMEAAEGQKADSELVEKDEIIENLTEELQQAKDAVLRNVAEYENLKKRLQKEKTRIYLDSKKSAIESFLPIRDDLVRSLEASEHIDLDEGFLSGIQMVAGKFENVLSGYGVEPIDEVMVPFDVDVHDALLRQPAEDESVEPNTVLKIVEPGYKIDNQVIKHAKVIVSQ
ncbi:MAG: nucleotide exchange factor GrpE [Balneolales bacterium]